TAGIANSLGQLGTWGTDADLVTRRALCQESLELHRELGSKRGLYHALHQLGNLAVFQGEYATARALLEQEIAILKELGNKVGLVYPYIHLAHVAYAEGQYVEARGLLEESLVLCRTLGDRRLVVEC